MRTLIFLLLTWVIYTSSNAANNEVYIDQKIGSGNNAITIEQSANINSYNVTNITVTGFDNIGTVNQLANGNAYHNFITTVTGNTNTFDIQQSGSAGHALDLTIIGNGNSATVKQNGNNSHQASVTLINAGGPASINLTQQSNVGQNYSVIQQCATAAGCSVSITQSGQ